MSQNRMTDARASVQAEEVGSNIRERRSASWRPSLCIRPNVEGASVPPRPGMVYIGDALKAGPALVYPRDHRPNVVIPSPMLLRRRHGEGPRESRPGGHRRPNMKKRIRSCKRFSVAFNHSHHPNGSRLPATGRPSDGVPGIYAPREPPHSAGVPTSPPAATRRHRLTESSQRRSLKP